jgi:hypothetical protein
MRACRSDSGQRPTRRYGAFAASVVAVLAYPLAVGPKPAVSDPATQPADLGLAQYDAIGVQLAHDVTALNQTQAQLSAIASQLRQQAVSSYVDGGSASAPFEGTGGYKTLLQKEYLATVTGNERDAVHRLDRARTALQDEQARLEADERVFQLAAGGGTNLQAASAASATLDPSAMSSLAINGPPDFAIALLKTLGDPVTAQNTQAIVAWCQREGGAWNSPAHFNPLNTSLKMPGSHAINGDGVQSYTSWSEGLTATVATLNSPSYRRILAALSAGNSVQAVESAVGASPWGTHF